jgi:hypothetical protein
MKSELGEQIFGITPEEAEKKCICINCKQSIEGRIKTKLDACEWGLSRLCPDCWEELSSEMDI